MSGFTGRDAIAKGQAFVLDFRVFVLRGDGQPVGVRLASNAATGATSLAVEPLEEALSSGDKLLFGKNTVVTLSSSAAAGVSSVSVDALVGPLRAAEEGRKLRNLTDYECEFEVQEQAGDSTPLVASGDVTVALQTQSGDERGRVLVTGLAAVTSGLADGTYFAALWRRNSGSERPLWWGDFEVTSRNFL